MKRRTLWTLALSAGLLAPMASFSQERGGGNRGGGFDFTRMQEERLNNTKADLGATDEEWQVLKPKIEKVWTAQFAYAGGFRGMFSSFRGGNRGGDRDRGGDRGGENRDRGGENRERGGDSNRQRGPVEQASRDLDELLQNKEAPADQVATKLAALREARAKAKTELEAAQKDLQSVLTPRQEAVLVAARTLE